MATICIEIQNKRNSYYLFQPTQQKLRARWVHANVAKFPQQTELRQLAEYGDIPGQRIEVDPKTKTCRIYDALGGDDYKQNRERLGSFLKNTQFPDRGSAPAPETRRDNASNDTIKEWLWHMAKAVQGGKAVLVKGSMPLPGTPEEIDAKLPGKRRKSPMAANAAKRQDYTDEVTAKAS